MRFIVLLITFSSSNGVRQAEVNDLLQENVMCLSAASKVAQQVTYRKMFEPIMEGEYTIRSQEEYLSAASINELETVDKEKKSSTWKVFKEGVEPEELYKIFNKRFPTVELKLNPGASSFGGLAVEGPLNPVLQFTAYGLTIMDGKAADNSSWVLEPTAGLGDTWKFWQPKSYEEQYDAVKKNRVFEGGNEHVTWENLCNFIGCDENYKNDRERHVSQGSLYANDNNVILQSSLRDGMCDMRYDEMKAIVNHNDVMKVFHKQAGHACHHANIYDFSQTFADALVSECFAECIAYMEPLSHNASCELGQSVIDIFFANLTADHTECAGLGADNLAAVAEWVMTKHCHTFAPPSPLWVMNDKGHGDVATHAPACKMHSWEKPFARKPEVIDQVGVCPEGTMCDCPENWMGDVSNAEDFRKGTTGFVKKDWDAAAVSIYEAWYKKFTTDHIRNAYVKQFYKAFPEWGVFDPTLWHWVDFTKQVLPNLIMNGLLNPAYLTYKGYDIYLAFKKEHDKWRCAKTVGCWNTLPERTKVNGKKGYCRLPQKTSSNPSPVWFMPPPMLKAVHRNSFAKACTLKACSEEDIHNQVLGRGGRDNKFLYNCQPLNYDDMTPDQKLQYKNVLILSGLDEEYKIEQ